MSDRTAANKYSEEFQKINTSFLNGTIGKEEAQKQAQWAYSKTRYLDFLTSEMRVDGILFGLGVQLRKYDDLLYRKNSPFYVAQAAKNKESV